MKRLLKKIDHKLDQLVPLLSILLVHIALRIPNLFEPHWYGDEAIYLTVGHGLRYGLKLYQQIVDHKTPLIYYLAMVPSQFWFKFLNLIWMSLAIVFFYHLAQKLFKNKIMTIISSFIFMLLTTLPWLEGNIANGELFVIGFVLAGLCLASKSNYFKWLSEKTEKNKKRQSYLWLFLGSLFFGLAILTKVPALLDLGVILAIAWFRLSHSLFHKRPIGKSLLKFTREVTIILTGVLTPILISILYYSARGTVQDYLQYGLLYNFHYVSTWTHDFGSPIVNFLMTLKGKLLILTSIFVSLTLLQKKISRVSQFIFGWLALSLFAVLLSNRPYPHYFLQTIPSLTLALVWVGKLIIDLIKNKLKFKPKPIFELGLFSLILFLGIKVFLLLNVNPYPTIKYYQKFYQLMTNQISREQYYAWFNPLTKDNYELAPFIQKYADNNRIFIWGTNPMLYAQTGTIPTGKFTVGFHIKDLKVYDQTMDSIKQHQPQLIIVMKDNTNTFPELNHYLNQFYYPNFNYQFMRVYLRKP